MENKKDINFWSLIALIGIICFFLGMTFVTFLNTGYQNNDTNFATFTITKSPAGAPIILCDKFTYLTGAGGYSCETTSIKNQKVAGIYMTYANQFDNNCNEMKHALEISQQLINGFTDQYNKGCS